MRKIVQISACSHYEETRNEGDYTLYALCDDGTLWLLTVTDQEWFQVKPIPALSVHNYENTPKAGSRELA